MQVQLFIPQGILYMILFSFMLEKYIVCDVCRLRFPPFQSSSVLLITHIYTPPCKTWYYKECNKKYKNFVLVGIRTRGTSKQTIFYNLQNICFSS